MPEPAQVRALLGSLQNVSLSVPFLVERYGRCKLPAGLLRGLTSAPPCFLSTQLWYSPSELRKRQRCVSLKVSCVLKIILLIPSKSDFTAIFAARPSYRCSFAGETLMAM
jgi:hypothetical protein